MANNYSKQLTAKSYSAAVKEIFTKNAYVTMNNKQIIKNLIISDTPDQNNKDEDKTNNNVSNLEWCDAKYNANYGTRNEKIVEAHSKIVFQIDKNTNVIINIFPSIREAERETGCNHGHICNCCKGKRKTAGNYKWRYA